MARHPPLSDAPFGVGFFSPVWPPGSHPNGIATYVGVVAPEVQASGHPVSILAGLVEGGPFPDFPVYDIAGAWRAARAERLLQAGLRRLAPALAVERNFEFNATVARRMVRAQGVRVLEMEESMGIAGRVQRAVSIPVVVRLHGPWFLNGAALGVPEDEAFRRRVEAEGRTLEAAAGVTAPTQDVLDRVRRRYGLRLERAAVIPNPCTPVPAAERWRTGGCDPRRLVFVGRFDRHKGGDLVLEAFAQVWREMPEARLTFVGPDRGFVDGAGRSFSLEAFARERLPDALAAGAVELLGQRPPGEVAGLRRRGLATVICSRYENFPGTVVESLAMGCPTIAADAGGIPEMIEDGVTGLLHRAGDAAHLASRMLELLRDPARAARLGEAGARAAERFHPKAVVPRILAYHAGVLRG